MKVLLVHPPSARAVRSILPEAVEEERGAFPPLGLLYLAAAISELPGVEVKVIDARAEGLGAQEIARRASEFGPDLAGISVMTFSLLDALDTAAALKSELGSVPVIAGGPHPHLFPKETLALGPFDAVFRGEGEIAFRELVGAWPESRKTPPQGFCWRDQANGENPAASPIPDLDQLPFPARKLVPLSLYHSVLSGLRPITTMMSSRGCPYRCIFCDRPHLGKRFRARSPQNVVSEMEESKEAGIKEVVFYDDTFTVSRDRALEIAELVLERKFGLPWDIRARVSDLKGEDYRSLREAGLARIHFGVESGDPRVLESLNKGITIEQAREAFRGAREAGIETLAYFMVGLPGETRESLERTLALARELEPDYVHFSLFIPFPGTPAYFQGLERGVIPRDVWAEFASSPSPDFSPPLWEENLSAQELKAALVRMYKGFYLRPGVIARRLRRVASLAGFFKSARMGLKILGLRSGN